MRNFLSQLGRLIIASLSLIVLICEVFQFVIKHFFNEWNIQNAAASTSNVQVGTLNLNKFLHQHKSSNLDYGLPEPPTLYDNGNGAKIKAKPNDLDDDSNQFDYYRLVFLLLELRRDIRLLLSRDSQRNRNSRHNPHDDLDGLPTGLMTKDRPASRSSSESHSPASDSTWSYTDSIQKNYKSHVPPPPPPPPKSPTFSSLHLQPQQSKGTSFNQAPGKAEITENKPISNETRPEIKPKKSSFVPELSDILRMKQNLRKV